MIYINKISISKLFAFLALAVTFSGCKKDFEDLEPATFPVIGEVFIDAFSNGLDYAAFGGSDVTGFLVVNDVVYDGDAAMRFAVPDVGDPAGSYVGGTYFVEDGRDLSGFDALTFWAKASKSASIDIIGFGNDLDANEYVASISDVSVNTNWKQYIIPLPNPSVLTQEKGMFFYSEGPENELGYTFWIDEVKFEKLGTLAQYEPAIEQKQDKVIQAETGQNITVGGLIQTVNLPTGLNQVVNLAPAYFTFSSSNTSVATVNENGIATILDAGTAVITAKLGELDAVGSLTIESSGEAMLPPNAPIPTRSQDSVISLYSNVYENELVDTWDTDWEFTTTETDFIQVDGDDMIRYRNLNFVGIEFATETKNVSDMTHFHMNIYTPDPTALPAEFKILLVDFGANNIFDGGDDVSHEITFTSPLLQTGNWISIEVPLSSFTGLTTRSNLAQMVLSGDLPNVFVDNVYFFKGEAVINNTPTTAAPAPSEDEANVISVYSDSYTDIVGTNLNPDWGQQTVFSESIIDGSNTILYTGLNYQGIEFISGQDVSAMTHLHIDYWTENSTALNAFLISTGPVETASVLGVPTTGWASADIPLSAFSPVDLTDIIQMKFDGNGSIYLDNIYFYSTSGGGNDCDPPQDPSSTTSFPINFQNCEDLTAVFESGDGVTGFPTENPDQSGANTSSRVYQFNKVNGAAWYSGFEHIFPSDFDMTVNKLFKMKVWSPKPNVVVRFQIEKQGSGGTIVTYQKTQTISNANTWTELSFDFTDQPFITGTDVYDKIVVIPDDQDNGPADGSVYYIDDIELTEGTSTASEPTIAAPAPIHDAVDVISVFSDAYTNISISEINPNWGQSGSATEVSIAGNNTLKYDNFNYQGTQFAMAEDMSSMEFVHIDMWTEDATDVKFTPIGAGEFLVGLTPITSGQWVSYDIPISDFMGVNFALVEQLKFDGQGGVNPSNIWLDNIYFYKEGGSSMEPTVAAPAPTHDVANVISVFSDAYTNIIISEINPNWGQSGSATEVSIAGNNTLKYDNFNYQGTQFAMAEDMSSMEFVHIDMWTEDATDVKFTPIGAGEFLVGLTPITSGQWVSYDIPISDFMGVNFALIEQLKFDGQAGVNPSNIWLDNIYFYKEGGSAMEPNVAAPTPPSRDAADVISVFSDAYTNIIISEINPNWGQSGSATEVSIAGNNTLKYDNFNYQGTQFAMAEDMSSMEFVHIDMWTEDATDVKFTPIGAGEFLVGLTPITSGQWVSYDIPVSDFMGVNFALIEQLKFDGQAGTNPSNIWLDNIYFYKAPSTGGNDCPTPLDPSATTIPIDFENCEDLSGVFEDGDGVTGYPTENPDQSGINTSSRVYQMNKVLGAAWYSGIFHIFPSNYDMTTTKVFKMKVWSPKPNVVVRFQIEKEGSGGSIVTYQKTQTVSNANTWTELTFDFNDQPFITGFNVYDKLTIIPDDADNGPADGSIYYIDDIILTN